jgi:hypothetical protein
MAAYLLVSQGLPAGVPEETGPQGNQCDENLFLTESLLSIIAKEMMCNHKYIEKLMAVINIIKQNEKNQANLIAKRYELVKKMLNARTIYCAQLSMIQNFDSVISKPQVLHKREYETKFPANAKIDSQHFTPNI